MDKDMDKVPYFVFRFVQEDRSIRQRTRRWVQTDRLLYRLFLLCTGSSHQPWEVTGKVGQAQLWAALIVGARGGGEGGGGSATLGPPELGPIR